MGERRRRVERDTEGGQRRCVAEELIVRAADVGGNTRAVDEAWPADAALATPEALARWMAFNWLDNNVLGLQGMVEREARDT